MGHGGYDYTKSVLRSNSLKHKSSDEIFTQRGLSNDMSPYNVVRESRDSAEHPNSFAIILALDETGSMGRVPNYLVKEGFNAIMDSVIKNGELDPQILFMGVGDHLADSAPLQVGQFESGDELLHKWLTKVYLEGNGGGNNGESYFLPWAFAAKQTSIDCFEKRGRKGLLFTVGDEHLHKRVTGDFLNSLLGSGHEDTTAAELLAEAQKKYDVYHINISETSSGSDPKVIAGWKELMGNNLLVVKDSRDVAKVIAETVLKHKQGTVTTGAASDSPKIIL
jgi:hypothetical protein